MSQSHELFSPHGSNPLKKSATSVQRVFSKEAKSFVINIAQRTSKLTLPQDMSSSANSKLNIVERYIIIQLNLATSSNTGHIEFTILTQKRQRRRMIFSPSFPKIKPETFHTQFPFQIESGWHNLCFDMFDLYSASFGESNLDDTYGFLEEITIGPRCEVRKVFVMQQNPRDEVFIPKKFNFITGVDSRTLVIDSAYYGLTDQQDQTSEQRDSVLPVTRTSPAKVPSNGSILGGKLNEKVVTKAFGRSYTPQEQPQSAKSVNRNTSSVKSIARAKSSNVYVSKSKKNPQNTNISQHLYVSSVEVQNTEPSSSRYVSKPRLSPRNDSTGERQKPYDVSKYQEKFEKPLKRYSSHSTLLGRKSNDLRNPQSILGNSGSRKNVLSSIQTSRSVRSTPNSTNSPQQEKLFEALKILEQDQSLLDLPAQGPMNAFRSYHSPRSPSPRNGMNHSFLDADTPELRSPVLSKSPNPAKDSDEDTLPSQDSDEEDYPTKISKSLGSRSRENFHPHPLYSADLVEGTVEGVDSVNLSSVLPRKATSPRQQSLNSDDEDDDDTIVSEEEFSVHGNSEDEKSSLSQERKRYQDTSIDWNNNENHSMNIEQDSFTKMDSSLTEEDSDQDKENVEVSLLYDPLFQCYYDPKSNKYYEAKDVK